VNDQLGQILFGIMRFLNQPWVSVVVGLGGGFAVALLARLSPPRGQWNFIEDLPSRAILVSFVVVSIFRIVPLKLIPQASDFRLTCEHPTGPFGIPENTNCAWVRVRPDHTVPDYTLAQMGRDFLLSLVQDLVYGAIGAGIGIMLLTIILRLRRSAGSTTN